MLRLKIIALISGYAAVMVASTVWAATLDADSPSVILTAGQTVEIPLSSTLPIASDLTARGAFQLGDVTFTDGPGCHLSAHNCTLLINAAPTCKNYTAVPVVLSESAATNTPVFTLSVIQPGEVVPDKVTVPEIIFTPLMSSKPQVSSVAVDVSQNTPDPQSPLQRSGNGLFYGIAEAHPEPRAMAKDSHNHFTAMTNGPVFQIVALTNNDVAQPLAVEITGSGADSFSLDNDVTDYGLNHNCATMTTIASGDSCLVIVKGKVGDPSQAPQTATLSMRGEHNDQASFTLTSTTYVYAAGGFNTLGNASVSGGDLLAQCTVGACSNALQGSMGHNFASKSSSVGQWINALRVTPTGNLLVGGVFGAIGGATSGATSGTAALLAQCTPGSMTGSACINQLNTGSTASPYVFSNAYIDGIGLSSTLIYLGGDFSNIRGVAVSGKMLAACVYNGIAANQNCSNYLNNTNKYANNTISAVDYLNSTVNVGGLFTQIATYPTVPPSSGTTFASCTSGICSQGMGINNPNSSILGMTDDGTKLYMGGVFTNIGGYADSNGGYPLVVCTPSTTTTCSNALSGSYDANGYIEGLSYSNGNLYVGGRFSTIGGATPVSGGNMLAVCTVGDTCSNFVTDTNPYASGGDWGGEIAAVAIGNQTTISAN